MIPDESLITDTAEQYNKEIIIPSAKPEHQFILCPVGLVGAGKTTVVKPLSEKLHLLRISGDDIRKILKEQEQNYDSVGKITEKLIEKYLDSGYSVCIDRDCVSPSARKSAEEAEKSGIQVVWIHINPPESFILNKLSNLKPNWLGTADDMVKNYYQRKPLHTHLDFPFVYTFDTSKESLPQQIDEAVRIINEVTNNVS